MNFRLNGVLLNYVHVLKPVMDYNGDHLEFSTFITFPDDHPQLESLEEAIESVADQAQLDDTYASPLRTPDDSKQVSDGELGINAKSRHNPDRPREGQPILVDSKRNPINSTEDIYSGCTANVMLSLFSYPDKTGGVGVGLSGIQVTHKGDRLDGFQDADEMFEEVEGFVSANSFDAEPEEEQPSPKKRRKAETTEEKPAAKKRGRPRGSRKVAPPEEDVFDEEDII